MSALFICSAPQACFTLCSIRQSNMLRKERQEESKSIVVERLKVDLPSRQTSNLNAAGGIRPSLLFSRELVPLVKDSKLFRQALACSHDDPAVSLVATTDFRVRIDA